MGNPFDQFDAPKASGANPFDQFDQTEKPSNPLRRYLADPLISGVKGAIGVPEAAVGLADMVSGGRAGKFLEDEVGFKPKEAKNTLNELYSPEQRAANEYVQQGEGFFDTLGRAIEKPSTIGHAVVESIPLSVGGGLVGRGMVNVAKVAPWVAGAVGEGLVGAGSAAEQIRQETEGGLTSPEQNALAAASGLGTGAFGAVGAKFAGSKLGQKLGIADIEASIAGGTVGQPVSKGVAGLAKRMAGGAVSEGPIDEGPQSAWEQSMQNLATGKPWYEGLGNATAMGILTGGVMGAGFNALPRKEPAAPPPNVNPLAEIAGLLPAPVSTGVSGADVVGIDTARQASMDKAVANAQQIYDARDAYEAMKAILPFGMPTVTTPLQPIQEQINALVGINAGKTLTGIEKIQYQQAMKKLLDTPVGITNDSNGIEIPLTMGDLLDTQARAEEMLRAKAATGVAPIPVVGPLSAAANTAVSTGAVEAMQPQPEPAPVVYPTGKQSQGVDYGDGGTGEVSVGHKEDGSFTVTSNWNKGTAKKTVGGTFPAGTDVNAAVNGVTKNHGGHKAADQVAGAGKKIETPAEAPKADVSALFDEVMSEEAAAPAATTAKKPEITYEQYKSDMNQLLQAAGKYKPSEVGFVVYSEKMAELADKYPEFDKRLDEESNSVPANSVPNTPQPAPPVKKSLTTEQAPKSLPAVRQELSVEFGGTRYPVDSIEDASKKWEKFREETGEGVSKLGNGVPIFDQTGKQIAYVSYNGTVWKGAKYDKNAKPLYEPKSEATPATPVAESKQAPATKAGDGSVATAQGGEPPIPAYTELQAKVYVNRWNKQGTPSEAYPHPTKEGKFAIRPAGTVDAAPSVAPETPAPKSGLSERVAESKANKSAQKAKQPDPQRDSLFMAIAKLGGMDTDELTTNGADISSITKESRAKPKAGSKTGALSKPRRSPIMLGFGLPLHKRGGLSFDGALEALKQYGYFPEDATKNDIIDAFNAELNGSPQYTNEGNERIAELSESARNAEMQSERERIDAEVSAEIAAENAAREEIGYDSLTPAGQDIVDLGADLDIDAPNIESDERAFLRSMGMTEREIDEELAADASRRAKQIALEHGQGNDAGRPGQRPEEGSGGNVQDGQGEGGSKEATGEEVAQSLELAGQTPAEVRAQEAKRKADEEAEKREEAPKTPNVKADQVDLFNTQGGLFNSNREEPKTESKPTDKQSSESNNGIAYNAADDGSQTDSLIIRHNLSAANLMHAIRMGGIPVPSLAITKKEIPFNEFGDITLLGSKAMADPKGYANTKVFGADIYSPRYPSIKYITTPNMRKRAEAMIKDGLEATNSNIEWDNVANDGVRELASTPALRWKFLKESGIEPKIARVEARRIPKELLAFKDDHRNSFDLERDKDFIAAAYAAHENELVKIYDGDAKAAAEEIEDLKSKAEERGVSYLVKETARQLNQYRMDSAAQGKVDTAATNRMMESQIYDSGLRDEMDRYAEEFLQSINPDEKIFKGYTYNGNRRYIPHTLENVVKELKKELRSGEGFNYGVGSIRAKYTPQFKSIKQIRESKSKLVDKESFDKIKDEMNDEFFALSEELAGHHPVGGEFRFTDTMTSMLYDAAKMGIQRSLKENGFDNVPADKQKKIAEFINKLRSLPTEYFEAKILRDVDLAEFSGAVIPENSNQKIIDALKSRGITEISTYKSGNKGDRVRAVSSLAERLNKEGKETLFNTQDGGPLAAADKAIYGMVSEGKTAAEVLKFIAANSRNPFYRHLSRLLIKTGISPTLTLGEEKEWTFNAGEGKYAAAYNPETDTVALFRPASSERNVLHELMHAATMKALEKNGLAAMQMRKLFEHVKKSGKLKGMYGMENVDEFIAEAFSNPKFQQALKKVSDPVGSTGLKSAWHWFVRVVRGILGLKQGSQDALSQALDIGLGVMRENMAMKQGAKDGSIRPQSLDRGIVQRLRDQADRFAASRAGNINASANENQPNRLIGDAHFLTNLAETFSFVEKGLGAFDVPSQRMVLDAMGTVLQNSQVRQSVIGSIPVDVVNVLGGGKVSAKILLNDVPMFLDLLSANGDKAVAPGVDGSGTAISKVARAAAKSARVAAGIDSDKFSFAVSADVGVHNRDYNRVFSDQDVSINKVHYNVIGDSGRAYDQAHRDFFKNVGRDINPESRIQKSINYLRNDFWKKMAVGIVDQFRGLRDLGDNGQAYMLARLSKGTAGAFETLLRHGKLSIKDGAYDGDQSGGFVDKLGATLQGELDDFLWHVAANRAEGLTASDRENLFTPADIAAGKSLSRGTTNFDYTIQTGPGTGTVTRNRALIYQDALRVFNGFQKNALDMAEQSGLIDGAARKFWESEFYVPFYRVSEDDGEFIGAKMGNALVRQQAFKKLKGGTDKLNSDLLANTLLNLSHLIEASAKNRAARAALAAAESIGVAQRVAPDMASYSLSNGTMLPPGTKKTVWFQENGKKVEYLVTDPFVMTAITSLEYAGMRNGVMDVMTKFKHWLTVGVTASPAFKVRNLIRDSLQAIGTSDLGYNPIKNVAEGFKQTRRDSQEYVSALASGGLIRFGTMLEGSESSRVRQLIKNGVKDSSILNNEPKWKQFYDKYIEPGIAAYNELGNRSEEINRAALYNQLIKQGKSHAEAALLARDLMDFSMHGSFNTIRFLTQVVPFMNARFQGLYKLGRSAKDNPRKLAIVTGAVALASIALMLGYDDDDDWRRREDWDRDNFWWFKFGGVEFRIPKPFEVGAVATLAERSVEYLINDEMTGERFRNVTKNLALNNLSMNPIPQAIKPVVDLYANKDSFTGRPIETMSMQRLDPTMRYNSGTSMVARGLSSATGSALSPVQYEHLARAYFGWLGAFVVGGADLAARPLTNEPSRPAPDYWKLATQGILREQGTGSSRYLTMVYDQAKELEQAHATYRQMVKEGKIDDAKEYAEDNADKLKRYRAVEQVKRIESKFNERIRSVERGDLEPDEKKLRIDRIQKLKEIAAKRIAPGLQ